MSKPIKRQTWSNIDVFGLLNGVSTWDSQYKSLRYVRKPYESSLDIREKIFRNHDYEPNITKQGLLNALSNEFGFTPYNVESKTIFELSSPPVPSGSKGVYDVFGYYLDGNEWQTLGNQVWAEDYEIAKNNKAGFIVWQNEKYSNISGVKNFDYSNLCEVFTELPDKTELKFVYYVNTYDENENRQLARFTDMGSTNDPLDDRFTYRIPVENPNISSGVVVYNLNDIPTDLKNTYYYDSTTGIAKEFLYDLKRFIDTKFKHQWKDIRDKTCIWDVHKNYGSGDIPNFYDAIVPRNTEYCRSSSDTDHIIYSGYQGGVEDMSHALYIDSIVEQSGEAREWYPKIYPGKFYIDGTPFYYFENPTITHIEMTPTTVSGINGPVMSGAFPSGIDRGMYSIMALSGYYEDYCGNEQDEFLSGVFEDYDYYSGPDGDSHWSNIYRKRPALSSPEGIVPNYKMGDYAFSFSTRTVYAVIPTGYENAVIIWDNVQVPSGSYLPYDMNPLNDQSLAFEKYFMYLSIDPNRRY